MSELLHTIATMSGLGFLLLYPVLLAAALLAYRLWLRRLDTTVVDPPPPIPSEPDPCELAYLRGGSRELTRLLTIGLLERRYLCVADRDGRQLKKARGRADPRRLRPIEQRIFQWFGAGRGVREALEPGGLQIEVEHRSSNYRERLVRGQLLMSEGDSERARAVAWLMLALLGGLAATMALVTLADRRIEFLLLGLVATALLIFRACPLPRLSRRGRAYLRRLRVAYAQLPLSTVRPSVGEVEPRLMLLIGLFGIAALTNTAYAHYTRLFPKAAGTGWSISGDEGSCGSCGSCGGCGGCGGCG